MYRNSGTALNEDPPHFLTGGGEMAESARSVDWSATELGSLSQWPQELRCAVSICLNSCLPSVLFWGDKYRVFFNDAFQKAQGASAFDFGRPAALVWGSEWSCLQSSICKVRASGHGSRTDWRTPPPSQHQLAQTYFECSLSPVYGESQRVEGVLGTLVDNTIAVVNERRMRTLRELAFRASDGTESEEELCQSAATVLVGEGADVSFAVLYLLDVSGRVAIRAGASAKLTDHAVCPPVINIDPRSGPIAIRSIVRTGRSLDVHNLAEMFGTSGPSDSGSTTPEQRAVILPITRAGDPQLMGFLVATVAPGATVNREYREFLNLVAEHISLAVGTVRAYEEQRQWAAALIDPDGLKPVANSVSEIAAEDSHWTDDSADGQRTLSAATITACDRFRAFFEQRAIFACILTVDGVIMESSGLLAELDRLTQRRCGFTRESIFGRPFWEGPWWAPSPAMSAIPSPGNPRPANSCGASS